MAASVVQGPATGLPLGFSPELAAGLSQMAAVPQLSSQLAVFLQNLLTQVPPRLSPQPSRAMAILGSLLWALG